MDGDISLHHEEIARSPLKKYFNLDRADEYQNEFDYILEWADKKGLKKPEDLSLELKKIEQRLGTAYVGEDRVTRIKNYLRSDEKLTSALKEMAAQERAWEGMV